MAQIRLILLLFAVFAQGDSRSENEKRRSIAKRYTDGHSRRHRHYESFDDYYRQYYARRAAAKRHQQNPSLYRVYPSLHPKDEYYCDDMTGMFAYTCQPSKPLRLDLVEFCKDYSFICHVPNFHRIPGPTMGAPPGSNHGVGVSGKFGFGIGSVPGMDIGVGWGVDVGPFPGMEEGVGVNTGFDLGLLGSKSPVAYRRGMDRPDEKGGGVVGISGGVGVKTPGSEGVGVNPSFGVGK